MNTNLKKHTTIELPVPEGVDYWIGIKCRDRCLYDKNKLPHAWLEAHEQLCGCQVTTGEGEKIYASPDFKFKFESNPFYIKHAKIHPVRTKDRVQKLPIQEGLVLHRGQDTEDFETLTHPWDS